MTPQSIPGRSIPSRLIPSRQSIAVVSCTRLVPLVLLCISLAACASEYDVTSRGTPTADAAVLTCEELCLVEISDSSKWLTGGQTTLWGNEVERGLFFLGKIKLDSDVYHVNFHVCNTGRPRLLDPPGLIYKSSLRFEALPGHRYEIIKEWYSERSACPLSVSIEDLTAQETVARWCYPHSGLCYAISPVSPENLERERQREEQKVNHKLRLLQEAERGSAEAQYELALMSSSPNEKWKWTCLAANQMHPRAQYEIGIVYETGRAPVSENLSLAYVWYRLAELNGFKESVSSRYRKTATGYECCFPAKSQRDIVAEQLDSAQIIKAERLVAVWQPDPAQCEEIAAQADN
jgi:hypothetical protein